MASSSNATRNGRVSFSGSTASLLLERSRISSSNRRPTPDSEALVSSDEEHSQGQPSQSQSLAFRRGSTSRPQSSWLSDVGHPQPARKFSLGGLSYGSGGSQPPTPSSETAPRLTNSIQGNGGGAAAFQPSIWSSERKQPPSRLTEVSQSPTTLNHPGIEHSIHSPGERPNNYAIGVEIPLDPVFKSGQRAMSFSVGQGDQLNRLRSGITRKNSAGGLSLHHGLGQLREDEDDLHSVDTDSDAGVKLPSDFASGSQELLKQAIRQRTTPTSAGLPGPRGAMPTRSMSFRTPDYALDEDDSGMPKPKWTTALGFDVGPSGLESRRHSLAGVPLRARAVSFAPTRLREEPTSLLPASSLSVQSPSVQTPPALDHSLSHTNESDFNYFGGQATSLRNTEYHRQAGFAAPGRHILYWVQFKCERGGVYYVVDGSGLSPKKGEMVLVEGDRGSDLGTVHAVDITAQQVKELRYEFQYRHFRWLIDFSRTAQTNPQVRWALSETVDARTAAARHPSNFHQGDDAKPKLIKRMAHVHEIQGLIHKEGAEAKAKRVCQQKVVEHGLQMEILDAEYQWDQRKLTFYYFAETYVNFNELVTDLFKIFKTRIWMSAVNPASFASAAPPGGLGMPGSQGQPSFGSAPIGGSGIPREGYPAFDSVSGWGGFSGSGGYNQPPSQPPYSFDGSTVAAPASNSSPLGNNNFTSQWPVPPMPSGQIVQNDGNSEPWARAKTNGAMPPQYNHYPGAPVRNAVNAWPSMGYPPSTFSGSPTAGQATAATPSTFVPPRNGHRTPQNEAQAAWYAAFANMSINPEVQTAQSAHY